MLYILYIALLLINTICLLSHKSSKMLSLFSIAFIILLMAGNTYNYDYIGYEQAYNGMYIPHFAKEYGLNFIFHIGNLLGLSYQGALFVIYTGCLLLNLTVAKKTGADIHLVCTLYLAFGFIADTVVMRNYIAISFLTNALFYLTRRERKKGLVFMILGFLFHKTMLFYFPLLLLDFDSLNIRRFAKTGAVFVVVLCAITFVNGGRFERLGIFLTGLLYGGKESIYLNTRSRYGFLLYFAVHIMTIFTVFYAKRMLIKNTKLDNDASAKLLNVCSIIDLYVVICFPLLMISTTMHRLYRNVMFFNFISLGIVSSSFSKNLVSRDYFRFFFVVGFYAILWRILYIFDIPEALEQIMNNNILFG